MTPPGTLLDLSLEHLTLVFVAMGLATLVGLPLGILVTRRPYLRRPVLALANLLQTVPSLALFGLLLPLPIIGGIGARTAVAALVLYALLPIVKNTVTGIDGVSPSVRSAAVAMGMTPRQILRQVELPLAAPVILTGLRVATVTCVGVATIAAAIGAGGLGTLIFRGLRMNDNGLVLEGAIPAGVMALALDAVLGLVERQTSRQAMRGPGRAGALVGALAALAVLSASLLSHNLGQRRSSVQRHEVGVGGGPAPPPAGTLVVGCKDFTEQLILGEILAQSCEAHGIPVVRRFELGGNLCHEALVTGRIDAYPEYTGTAYTVILKRPPLADPSLVREEVRRAYAERFSVTVGPPLGFRNDFAILVRGDDARRLGLSTISDVAPFAPQWRVGFGQDFMSRPDGYAGFVRAYGLSFSAAPREMDLSLTYRALAAHEVDLIAGNATDGLIPVLDLADLRDDRGYFPPYEAVYLLRREAVERVPGVKQVVDQLASTISTATMRELNGEVDGRHRSAADVARGWRERHGL